ncbi:MAG: type I restriction-modification enzyme R subunit C-terminal domain-containing protein, partial [Enterovibrio sp.]
GTSPFVGEESQRSKYYVNGVAVKVMTERVQYYDSDGKLVTESFKDYTKKTLLKEFATLDAFTKRWQAAERKQVIMDELAQAGVLWDVLQQEVGKELDPFDLICHVVYDQPPLTRRERANNVKKRNYFTKYNDTAQLVLASLLDKYADQGVREIETKDALKVAPFTELGRPLELAKKGFGGPQQFEQAITELEQEIYRQERKQHSA